MIIAANFKTNLTRKETEVYLKKLEENIKDFKDEVLVFPATSSLISHNAKTIIGAQNAYATNSGAYTGEIGLIHLEEFSIKTILIGHSERRHILGESQEEITKKFKFFKEKNFKIVYCVGEPLDVREKGEEALLDYINAQFEGIDVDYENLIIAYEPVWAIGTGLTATLEQINQLHAKLKQKTKAPILYGGSVKVANAKEILSLNNVDGVLVGSASLKVEDFSKMVEIANNINKY